MKKRGLSTIVITLIIILISLVAVGIIWVVVRNVIQTGTKEVTLGQFTLDAKIKDVNLYNSSNNVSLTIKRNPGVGEFNKMNFVFYDGKSSEVVTQSVSLSELEEKWFMFHLSTLNVSELISVSIFPYVKQDEKEILGNILDKYTVSEQGSTITLPVCVPATCASLGKTCGTGYLNGSCSGTLSCGIYGNGSCQTGYSCASGSCVVNITYTETFYVCQGGNGSAPKVKNCATAWSADNVSISTNWNTAVAMNDGKIGPGDRIYFMHDGGTITGTSTGNVITIQSSGTATNRITLEGDGSAVIDGEFKRSAINGQLKNYITVKNLNLTRGMNSTIGCYACDNWTVENCDLSYCNFTAFNTGTLLSTSGDGWWIHHNNFSHTFQQHLIYFWSQTGAYGSDNNLIEYNYFNDAGEMGIHINGIDTQFYGNVIRYNYFYNAGGWGDVYLDSGDGTQVYGNIFIHDISGRYLGIGLGDDYTTQTAHVQNTKIWNNVFYGYFQGMIYMTNVHTVGSPCITELYNNIFYSLGGACAPSGGGASCSDQNYIVYANESAAIAASDYNLFYSIASAKWKLVNGTKLNFTSWKTVNPGFDINSLETNPLLVNPLAVGGDFRLQSTSPCINAGKNVGLTKDCIGTLIPQGAAPDIGPYERI